MQIWANKSDCVPAHAVQGAGGPCCCSGALLACAAPCPSGSMGRFLWSSSPASVVAGGYSFPDTGLCTSPCWISTGFCWAIPPACPGPFWWKPGSQAYWLFSPNLVSSEYLISNDSSRSLIKMLNVIGRRRHLMVFHLLPATRQSKTYEPLASNRPTSFLPIWLFTHPDYNALTWIRLLWETVFKVLLKSRQITLTSLT